MAAAILITGANRGLGFEFASQYVADGWRVFAACRSPAAATKLQRLAQDTEGMTDAESVKNAATQLKDVAKRYRSDAPNRIKNEFDAPFARLDVMGPDRVDIYWMQQRFMLRGCARK